MAKSIATADGYNAAINTLQSGDYQGYANYWPTYLPYYNPTTYLNYPIPSRESARYRFALELLAEGNFTKQQMQEIVKEALKA